MSYGEIPDEDQAKLLAQYQPLRGWPQTLEGYPLRQALRLAKRQQRPAVMAVQLFYERALAGKRSAEKFLATSEKEPA